jgi:hypothetical protein
MPTLALASTDLDGQREAAYALKFKKACEAVQSLQISANQDLAEIENLGLEKAKRFCTTYSAEDVYMDDSNVSVFKDLADAEISLDQLMESPLFPSSDYNSNGEFQEPFKSYYEAARALETLWVNDNANNYLTQ